MCDVGIMHVQLNSEVVDLSTRFASVEMTEGCEARSREQLDSFGRNDFMKACLPGLGIITLLPGISHARMAGRKGDTHEHYSNGRTQTLQSNLYSR